MGAAALAMASPGRVFAQPKTVKLGFVYRETKTDAFVQTANASRDCRLRKFDKWREKSALRRRRPGLA